MSQVDIHHMYSDEKSDPVFSFSMVISPWTEDLKVLAVRLTEAGRQEIDGYVEQCNQMDDHERPENIGLEDYTEETINVSPTKYYYHVPLILCEDPSFVADLRNNEAVIDRLKKCVGDCEEDEFWLSRH